MACIAYQAYYNQAPDSINNLFIKHHPQRALRDNLKFQIQRPYYNQAPDSINNLFIKHHPQRALRDNLKFQIQRPNSNFRRDSFSHRACNLWNNLPVTIKNKPSLSLFKKALKNQPRVINTISFDGIVGTNKDIDVFIY